MGGSRVYLLRLPGSLLLIIARLALDHLVEGLFRNVLVLGALVLWPSRCVKGELIVIMLSLAVEVVLAQGLCLSLAATARSGSGLLGSRLSWSLRLLGSGRSGGARAFGAAGLVVALLELLEMLTIFLGWGG